jgi:hypothetical protein
MEDPDLDRVPAILLELGRNPANKKQVERAMKAMLNIKPTKGMVKKKMKWPEKTPKYRKLPIDLLFVDVEYQREVEKHRVDKIAANFDPELLGTVQVSERSDGRFAVIDGQHRVAALRELGSKNVPCLVHEGLDRLDEARLFVANQTNRKALRPFARWRADLFRQEPQAVAIQAAANRAGFSIVGTAKSGNQLSAVVTLEAIYRRGGVELLDKTLDLIRVWQDLDEPVVGALIEGIAVFISRTEGNLDEAALRAKLMETPPRIIKNRAFAEAAAAGGGGSRSRAFFIASEVMKTYNHKRRSGRLRLVRDESEEAAA